jgi:hypothetical protein
LLALLGDLDGHYRLDVDVLCRFLGVGQEGESYTIPTWFNALTSAAIFRYIKDEASFGGLRAELERWLLNRVSALDQRGRRAAEQVILVLDALAAPHISKKTKTKLIQTYQTGATSAEVDEVLSLQGRWFTQWETADLYSELRMKRVQEVY